MSYEGQGHLAVKNHTYIFNKAARGVKAIGF